MSDGFHRAIQWNVLEGSLKQTWFLSLADADDPKYYTFAKTDAYIAAIIKNGTQITYRLGESIESRSRQYSNGGFHVQPPKDNAKLAKICVNIIRHCNEGWAYLLGDLLVVRLRGVLTAAEQHLTNSRLGEKGRGLLKQMRTHLIETARPILETTVQEITGVTVLTMHHDISTVTGEEIVLFTLAESPIVRDAKT